MQKTIFIISKMDCPSEERIIRMKLEEMTSIKHMDFNIPQRLLTVTHQSEPKEILEKLIPLKFGASIQSTNEIDSYDTEASMSDHAGEAKLLKTLMAINGGMFFIEMILGVFADSMGLISDSLDMLADAGVYGISIYAVGKTVALKKKSALTNGYFQLFLGTVIIIETIRRFFHGSDPEPSYMIIVSLAALAANVYCMVLLSKHKDGEVHMKASYICSSTDVMANIGVVLAGIAVFFTKSPYPDLVIGIVVTGIVLRGALTILKLGK